MYSDGNAGEPILARCEGKFFFVDTSTEVPSTRIRFRSFLFEN